MPPLTARTDDHGDGKDGEHERVGRDAEPEAEAAEQRARQHEQERDAHGVHDRGVAGEESGQVRGVRVLRDRAVVDQKVGELAAERREDLIGEDEHHEPACE